MPQTTVTVAGNATLDAIIDGTYSIKEKDVSINSGGVTEIFHIKEPLIMAGLKCQANQNIDQKVKRLWNRIIPGGGGYNSVIAIRNLLETETKLQLAYIDVSIPNSPVINSLKEHNIYPYFFFQREIPTNAIIGSRKDRIVLKSLQAEQVEPNKMQIQEIEKLINRSDSFLINSIKDPKYFECYLKITQKYDVPVYTVLTTSLEPKFVFKKVIPNTNVIFNYDELPKLHDIKEKMDEQSRMKLALETLRKIRKDKTNSDKLAFVTLGKNGVYCAKKDLILHVKLNSEYAKKVKPKNDLPAENMRGAGDVFAAAITVYNTLTKNKICLPDLLIKASTAAIKHIGYQEDLPANAFLQKEYKI